MVRLCEASLGGPAHVLHYLVRYTHRMAISNHRLLAFDGQRVSFLWRDYSHTVDPALAKALDLKIEGATGIIGVGNYQRTAFTRLDSVQVGYEIVEQVVGVIQDLGQIQIVDSHGCTECSLETSWRISDC